MYTLTDGGAVPSLSRAEVTMDLTMCGLLVDRAARLARLYRDHGTWNEVKERWFADRLSDRSTRESARKIYRVLSSRLKHAPASLPNPSELPAVLDACSTRRDRAQVFYQYLVADDPLVRYVVDEYADRMAEREPPFDFSNAAIGEILSGIQYADGGSFDYADSTTQRWCAGFRSVMREIGALADQAVEGHQPTVGDVPLLVALGHSYEAGDDDWHESPRGFRSLLQQPSRWDELYDRAASTGAWEFVELHGSLELRPEADSYSWINSEVTFDE